MARRRSLLQVVDGGRDGDQHGALLALRLAGLEALGIFFLDEAGRQAPLAPARMVHQCADEGHVVLDAVDIEGVEGVGLGVDGGDARRPVGDELGDHRIVEHRDLAALLDAGVVAHRDVADLRSSGWRAILHQAADGRQEVAEGVLGVDAALDGPAVELHVRLLEGQLLAVGGADHQLDEVDAGDHLGDRMLDLEARVHLEEEEAPVLAGDELDRAGRGRSPRPWRGRRPARPWPCGSSRRAAETAPPR